MDKTESIEIIKEELYEITEAILFHLNVIKPEKIKMNFEEAVKKLSEFNLDILIIK